MPKIMLIGYIYNIQLPLFKETLLKQEGINCIQKFSRALRISIFVLPK